MKKPPLQDVIVKPGRPTQPRRVSAGVVSPHQSRTQRSAPSQNKAHAHHQNATVSEPPVTPFGNESREERFHKKWLYFALASVTALFALSLILSFVFAGAKVTVYPKQETVVVDTVLTASNSELNPNALSFKRITTERTQKQEVTASEEKHVEERAHGTLTIYNKFSKTEQRLIKNTRFRSSDGRIYRVRESVTVPGMHTDGTPGSIDVTVYAEEAGKEYNMGPDTFSIPGFKGLPQEGLVYATSKGNMEGGFVGTKREVSVQDRKKASEQIKSTLKDELLATVFDTADIPEGYFLPKEAVYFEFTDLPDEDTEGGKVMVSFSGKLHGILFNKKEFAKRLAYQVIGTYEGEDIRIENLNELSIKVTPIFSDDAKTQAFWEAQEYKVAVNGKAHFIWEYDEESLKRDLAGKDKNILDTLGSGGILEAYPGIDRTVAVIRPFWKQTFPEDIKDITIITKLDE